MIINQLSTNLSSIVYKNESRKDMYAHSFRKLDNFYDCILFSGQGLYERKLKQVDIFTKKPISFEVRQVSYLNIKLALTPFQILLIKILYEKIKIFRIRNIIKEFK